MAAENGFALLKQQQTNRVMGRTAIVQKVIVEQEPTFGKLRYELETKGGTGTEKYIHVDPNKEPQVYQTMLKLLPDIATLTPSKRELRSLVLAKQWEVEYCYAQRTFKNSSREVKVAVNIRQIPPKAAPDLPAWAPSDDAMHEFAFECHTVWAPMTAGNFLDQTLGLPRSAWPNRAACKAKIDEAQKATGKQLRPVEPEPQEQPENLDEWFPKEGQPVDDPKTDELMANLSKLTGHDDTPDELTQPTKEQWAKFWESIRHAAHDLPIENHHDYLHLFYDVASTKDTGKPLNEMLIEMGQHFSKVRAGKESLKTAVSSPENEAGVPDVPVDTPTGIVDGTNLLEQSKQTKGSQSEKAMQNEGCVTTVVMINNHELKITAWAGESGDEIASNVLALLNGLRIVAQSDQVKNYAAVSDGRDSLTVIKREGDFLKEPIKERVGNVPSNITPISSAPSAQQADSGTADCFMIKVGKTFKKDKDQILFECNGFEEPLKYSAKNTGLLLNMVANLRKADGSAITAAELVEGAKLPVRGKVNWKKSDDGQYTNVVSTAA